jgi:hypothetical protein
MTATAETTLTEFLRDPNAVAERLEHADVVLHRRNAEDIRLSLESRSEAVATSVRFLARVLGAALSDDLVRERLRMSVDEIPWVAFLPDREREKFTREFLRTAEAAAELGSMTPLAQLLHEWQATATVHADPALAAELRRPLTGAGEQVARPRPR